MLIRSLPLISPFGLLCSSLPCDRPAAWVRTPAPVLGCVNLCNQWLNFFLPATRSALHASIFFVSFGAFRGSHDFVIHDFVYLSPLVTSYSLLATAAAPPQQGRSRSERAMCFHNPVPEGVERRASRVERQSRASSGADGRVGNRRVGKLACQRVWFGSASLVCQALPCALSVPIRVIRG